MTLSSVSLQPLKLIEYPPNAGFFALAMCSPPLMIVALGAATSRGYYYHMYEGAYRKNPTSWGLAPTVEYRGGVRGLREGGHHLAGEPAELLHELLGRQSLGPVDHEVLQPRVLGLDGPEALDDVGRRPAEPGLLPDPLGQRGHRGRRAGRAPRAPLLVGVAHEPKGGEPLVALVVRGLHPARGLLRRVGEIEPGAPDDVLAELLGTAVPSAGVAIGPEHVVEDLLAVEGDHGLEVPAGHVVD